MNQQIEIEKLKNLPSLKKGWVRLVHRCIYKDHVENIKKNGLIFNRNAANSTAFERGGSYDRPTSMVSVYNENTFWQSLYKDDFACFDNSRYADTKLIFDMPLDEFCLLEATGKIIKGKIDSKYLVGQIANINSENKELALPVDEIKKAEQISRKNPASSVFPNNVKGLIDAWCKNINPDKKEKAKSAIYKAMQRYKNEWIVINAKPMQNNNIHTGKIR